MSYFLRTIPYLLIIGRTLYQIGVWIGTGYACWSWVQKYTWAKGILWGARMALAWLTINRVTSYAIGHLGSAAAVVLPTRNFPNFNGFAWKMFCMVLEVPLLKELFAAYVATLLSLMIYKHGKEWGKTIVASNPGRFGF